MYTFAASPAGSDYVIELRVPRQGIDKSTLPGILDNTVAVVHATGEALLSSRVSLF